MAKKFEEPIGKKFEMPRALLNNLGECAPEGWVLFFIDQQGMPQVRANFTAPIFEMGLRAYASKFLKGRNMVEESNIVDNILEEINTDSDEDLN